MKKIIITGGSGFVGSILSERLLEKGYVVSVIDIVPSKNEKVHFYTIALHRELISKEILDGVYGIIHLAGAPISGKWTKEYKKLLRDSRIETTKNLRLSFEKAALTPEVFVSASAVGFYGNGKDIALDENASPGNDFLAQICVDWEKEAFSFEKMGTRVVALRTAHVLGRGGILSEMLKLFKLGLGGYFGNGTQYMPWVHVEDLVSQYIFALENKKMTGVYNTATGTPLSQKTFMRSIQKVFGFFWTLPIPAFIAQMVKGEFAHALLGGQKIDSTKIKKAGFTFAFDDLHSALSDIKKKYYSKH
ncbi:MAG: TIGR01777 family oxidoreductase [Candidatus Pacebacteria bacterium]|jgi:hypothetical protein|nr:TIGR01777 family oxidoreductase [Candidatus Paceibacterota bacterium]